MRSPKITRIKFLSINRDIRRSVEANTYSAKDIAQAHHVSESTVRSIKRAKSWPGYCVEKEARALRHQSIYKVHAAAPQLTNEEQISRTIDEALDQAVTQRDIENLKKFVISPLSRRIERLENAVNRPARRNIFGVRSR